MQFRAHNPLFIGAIAAFIIFTCLSYGEFKHANFENQQKVNDKSAKPPGLGNPEVHKLTDNVYAVTGLYHTNGSVNAGIIFTENSVIFIDSGMTIASGEFLWKTARERMKGDEKLYLILTHHHSDHTFGMRVIKEKGAKIIAHKIVKEELKDDNGFYKNFIIKSCGWDKKKGDEILGDVVLSVPDEIIENDTILNIDGDEIQLLVTPGHVPDELSVYHAKSRTLFAGDTIYEGMRPNAKFGGPEDWKLWISQLERLKQLDIKTIVPGHGNLCTKEVIDQNISSLQKLLK
jgi:glyoxylase-like metal-dependent hydrolase (beta-lactamase superfamily II)